MSDTPNGRNMPKALFLAGLIDKGMPLPKVTAQELLRLHAEVERLNAALRWEQDRSTHIGTHGPGCHMWGHRHYECLLREYRALTNGQVEEVQT